MKPRKTKWELGRSVQDRSIEAVVLAPHGSRAPLPAEPGTEDWPWILFIGGVHGDEVEGVWLIKAIAERWAQSYPSEKIGAVLAPEMNPDGVALNQRHNATRIDLNRNLPTYDWSPEIKNPRYPPGPAAGSEPETQALVQTIEKSRPIAILSAHSFSQYQVNINGPAKEWGERLSKICGYPVTEDIGYPTPGSLGTYSGKERKIPTITLEIERGLPKEKVLSLHLPVIEEALRFWEERLAQV